MASVRRKRAFAIITVLCFLALVVLYKASQRVIASVKTVRPRKSEDITWLDVKERETVSSTVPLPTKRYLVVPIGVEEEEVDEIIISNIANNAPTSVAKSGKEVTKNAPNTVANYDKKVDKNAPNTVARNDGRNARNIVAKNDKKVASNAPTIVAENDKEIAKNAPNTVARNDKKVASNAPTIVAKNDKDVAIDISNSVTKNDKEVAIDIRNSVTKNDKEVALNTPNTVAKNDKEVSSDASNVVAQNDKEVAKNAPTVLAENDKELTKNVPTTVAKNNKELAKNVPTTVAKSDKKVAKTTKFATTKKLRHSTTQRPSVVEEGESKLDENHQKSTAATDSVPLACKVPVLDPFNPVVSPLIRNVGTDLRKRCRSMYPRIPAFKIVDNKLVLHSGINESQISRKSIRLKAIERDGDLGFTYMTGKNPFLRAQSIRESKEIGDKDFFRLYYAIDGKRVSDLYARIAPKVDILERQMSIVGDLTDQGIPLSVVIIGFDSTSTANFERKMGGVISFLKTQMNTYFMEGMSIVGDATTPALTALLTGKYETKLPEGRRAYDGHHIDNWPWIMKEYEKHGYMTLYAEDDPGVSAFNLRLEGFHNSPVHHYMRPFWLSLERESERDDPGLCSNSESMANLTLKYMQNFLDAYPKARKFAFGFMSYLTHSHPNHLSYAENDLLWFLRTFVKKGYHKDTMLVIMGDHGSRNSEFRGTMQGKLEERLPWFSISLPASFHQRYPDLAGNLRSNQDIISSPFDVHATLRHLLTYPKMPSNELTQSLFTKLPRTRTCNDAGIAEHWCPCFKSSPVNVASKEVQRIALATVQHINNELSKFTVLQTSCHRLSLDSIQDAVLLRANTKVQRFSSTNQDGDLSVMFGERTTDYLLRYQVIFNTRPNNGKYEATISVSSDGRMKVNPEISRINRYNNQPKCIAKEYPYARKFCFCKT